MTWLHYSPVRILNTDRASRGASVCSTRVEQVESPRNVEGSNP